MTTLSKTNKINIIFYLICFVLGLILILFDDSNIYGMGGIVLIIAVSGIINISCNRNLKFNKYIKIILFIIGSGLLFLVNSILINNEKSLEHYETMYIVYSLLSVFVFVIARICLMKEKAFLAIGMIMPPVIISLFILFTEVIDFEYIIGTLIWIVLGIIAFCYGGSQPQYYQRPPYLVLRDGRRVEHVYDNVYRDINGRYYTLDCNGNYLEEK